MDVSISAKAHSGLEQSIDVVTLCIAACLFAFPFLFDRKEVVA
jgi:hypothetical protein